MMKLHGCKKCQGALILDKDEFGWFEQCIQCGYTRDIPLDIFPDTLETGDAIPVTVISNQKILAEAWKQNKLPSFTPLKNTDGPGGEAY